MEWTVLQGDKLELVKADSEKEAILKALHRGTVPERHLDVRPRTGDADMMTEKQFNKFLDKHTK